MIYFDKQIASSKGLANAAAVAAVLVSSWSAADRTPVDFLTTIQQTRPIHYHIVVIIIIVIIIIIIVIRSGAHVVLARANQTLY